MCWCVTTLRIPSVVARSTYEYRTRGCSLQIVKYANPSHAYSSPLLSSLLYISPALYLDSLSPVRVYHRHSISNLTEASLEALSSQAYRIFTFHDYDRIITFNDFEAAHILDRSHKAGRAGGALEADDWEPRQKGNDLFNRSAHPALPKFSQVDSFPLYKSLTNTCARLISTRIRICFLFFGLQPSNDDTLPLKKVVYAATLPIGETCFGH